MVKAPAAVEAFDDSQENCIRTANHDIKTDEEYTDRLNQYNIQVKQAEKDAIQDYLASRVAFAVGTKLGTVITKANGFSCVTERKRKMFFYDCGMTSPIDYERLRRHRKSFSCLLAPEGDSPYQDDHDKFFEIVSETKSADEGQRSDDIIIVITPMPKLTSCNNKPLAEILKKIASLHPKPKFTRVGEVERHVKRRGTLIGVMKDCMTVVCENSYQIELKQMEHLSGHTRYHKWEVPDIGQPWTISKDDMNLLFGNDRSEPVQVAQDSDNEDASDTEVITADEKASFRAGEVVIPYPREKHLNFGQELINTFQPDVVMTSLPLLLVIFGMRALAGNKRIPSFAMIGIDVASSRNV